MLTVFHLIPQKVLYSLFSLHLGAIFKGSVFLFLSGFFLFVQWLRNNAYSANLFFFPVLLLTASFTCWSVLVSVLCLRTGFPCHNPLPPFKLIRFWYQFETGTWWPWIGAKGRWWMPFLKPGTNGLFSLCYQIAF